ncbi:hypothetical protein K4F52_006015 [Lecanicillium sp. MT-2017a]|nr:hypothetical protein K4F52_006015 [Lecanicillium sp. MT-2017a]
MATSADVPAANVPKHRACDECRARKLACSKEPDGCSRCKKEGIPCYYSPQKPMGRPRKRRHTDEAAPQTSPPINAKTTQPGPVTGSFALDPSPVTAGPEHSMSFLNHQHSPDMSYLDLIPDFYHQPQTAAPSPGMMLPMASPSQPLPYDGSIPIVHTDMNMFMPYSSQYLEQPSYMTQHPSEEFGHTPPLSVGSHQSYSSSSPPSNSSYHMAMPADDGVHHGQPLKAIPTVSCGCLSSLYMALESLGNLPQQISPAMRITRSASKIAHEVIVCKTCSQGMEDPTQSPPLQSFQNLMFLGALVPSACNAYAAIVEMVDAEYHQARAQNRLLHFSFRDVGGQWGHTLEQDPAACLDIQAFDNCDLDPDVWRRIMLAILRLDVYGSEETALCRRGGPARTKGLKDIITMLDERSNRRHSAIDEAIAQGNMPKHSHYMMFQPTGGHCKPEDRNCTRVLQIARIALDNLVIA